MFKASRIWAPLEIRKVWCWNPNRIQCDQRAVPKDLTEVQTSSAILDMLTWCTVVLLTIPGEEAWRSWRSWLYGIKCQVWIRPRPFQSHRGRVVQNSAVSRYSNPNLFPFPIASIYSEFSRAFLRLWGKYRVERDGRSRRRRTSSRGTSISGHGQESAGLVTAIHDPQRPPTFRFFSLTSIVACFRHPSVAKIQTFYVYFSTLNLA